MFSYIYLAFAISFSALGQFFYKKYYLNARAKIYLLLTIFCLVLTPFFSFQALKGLTIDTVYIATSITILLVIFLSKVFLKEILTRKKIIGIVFIILGVLLYGL